jgi:hypothetical protein
MKRILKNFQKHKTALKAATELNKKLKIIITCEGASAFLLQRNAQ